MAFERFPKHVRDALGGELWAEVGKTEKIWVTRAMDVIDIYEIGRLGRKQRD